MLLRRWLLPTIIVIGFGISSCNRPSELFLPIIVGEATAAPTILDLPTVTPVTTTVTGVPTRATEAPTATGDQRVTPVQTRVTTPVRTAIPTPLDSPRSTPRGTPAATRRLAGAGTPVALATESTAIVVTTPAPTRLVKSPTPTVIFYRYLAQILSQLQPTATATLPPVPIVLTPTPRPPTVTPTAMPTNSPTPFTGSVRLLERDPVFETDLVPVIAYAVPDSRFDASWSDFYMVQPQSSELVRIYASDNARTYDPVIALTSREQWAEGVCMVSSTMVGVQFWGDENDGWARVLVDGVERWQGNTYGRSPEPFVRFLEIRDLKKAPHVIRIEPLGQPGTNLAHGDDHVSIYAVVCGLPVETQIFVPILQR